MSLFVIKRVGTGVGPGLSFSSLFSFVLRSSTPVGKAVLFFWGSFFQRRIRFFRNKIPYSQAFFWGTKRGVISGAFQFLTGKALLHYTMPVPDDAISPLKPRPRKTGLGYAWYFAVMYGAALATVAAYIGHGSGLDEIGKMLRGGPDFVGPKPDCANPARFGTGALRQFKHCGFVTVKDAVDKDSVCPL